MSFISQFYHLSDVSLWRRLILTPFRHVNGSLTNKTDFLLPFYMNAQGGDSFQATQCATGGTNSLQANIADNNDDLNNEWPRRFRRDFIV
jgi:hypothetical protein